ncbi:hypothetical protein WR25_06238 [Diploscapter pachys]|uniref:Uncharacterized protein n=1 Tax=Diploscapter pachys TaxID=2018661 RepID=A0A2A2LX24_9BILA|nr:hypothetical protein WR25_06238 [Diploscapter pachys]
MIGPANQRMQIFAIRNGLFELIGFGANRFPRSVSDCHRVYKAERAKNVMRFFILLLAFIAVALAQFPGGHNNAGGLGEKITEDNPPEVQAAEGISINEGSGEDDSGNVDEVRTAIFHSADQVHAAAAGAAAARRK